VPEQSSGEECSPWLGSRPGAVGVQSAPSVSKVPTAWGGLTDAQKKMSIVMLNMQAPRKRGVGIDAASFPIKQEEYVILSSFGFFRGDVHEPAHRHRKTRHCRLHFGRPRSGARARAPREMGPARQAWVPDAGSPHPRGRSSLWRDAGSRGSPTHPASLCRVRLRGAVSRVRARTRGSACFRRGSGGCDRATDGRRARPARPSSPPRC
jgi:hypothetical protein